MLDLNLQLFAGEKTEKATPRQKQKAREEGRVVKSVEINSAFIILISFVLFRFFFADMFSELQRYLEQALSSIYVGQDLTIELMGKIFTSTLIVLAKLCLPLMGVVLVTGLVANYAQVGVLFTVKPLEFKPDKLNPITGMKRFFSARALVDLVKSTAKIAIIGYVAYSTIKGQINVFATMLDMSLAQSLPFIGQLVVNIGIKVAVILIILAFADYLFQKYDYEKSLRMSKEEVKQEHKNIEGDPQIKGKIKQKQRQMAMQRMMQEVPKADVIITNPTHFAVALKYDGEQMAAPQVVAKGVDQVAQNIKKIAQENDVPTVENRPLAQALYKACEIGDYVPPDLFQAVAEVLAFVYRLKGKI